MVEAMYPSTLEEALRLLKETSGLPLAGGTDLMVRHRPKPGTAAVFHRPLVYIGNLPELNTVSLKDGAGRIGAAVPMADLLEGSDLPPGLAPALMLIGSPAIRNSATLAGNICNASPAADSLPALYCLKASVETSDGLIRPMDEFITGPGTTCLEPGVLVTGIIIPKVPGFKVFYRKIGTRRANALSKLSFLGLYRIEDGIVTDLRIALGAASPRVLRLPEAEKRCIGRTTADISADAAALAALYEDGLDPIDDQRSTAAYRRRTALRLLEHFFTREIMKDD